MYVTFSLPDLERNMNKMNCILISAFITLVVFCSSGKYLSAFLHTCKYTKQVCHVVVDQINRNQHNLYVVLSYDGRNEM